MLPRITDVQYRSGFRLELTFSDGVRGEVDLAGDIIGQGGVCDRPIDGEDAVLAHFDCLRSVDGLDAGRRRCCPAAFDRSFGIHDVGGTEAEALGSKPTGEDDRSAQRRHCRKSPRGHQLLANCLV